MAGFDLQAIDPQYKLEILKGLVGDMDSMFLQVFRPRDVNSQSGKIPILPSKETLRSDEGAESSKVALDAPPKKGTGSLTDVSYNFDGKFSRENSIPKATVEEARNFNSAEELLAFIQQANMIQIAGDVDSEGNTILGSTTLNTQVNATAVWSDDTNARPVTDLDALMDTGGNAYDLLWVGESRYRELSALPALLSFSNNYDAVDARAPKTAVANWLLGRYDSLQEVVIEGNWYNTNGLNAAVSTDRQFDDIVWAGKRDQMIALEFEAMRETDEWYDKKTQEYGALATIWIEIVTGEDLMTATLTGT